MMSRTCLLSLAGLMAALTACKNPKYCDADTPCEDPVRSFCDLTGTVSGIENNCTEPPGGNPDASTRCDSPSDCSGATPACKLSTGLCVECIDVSTCGTPEEPTCNTTSNMCSGCTGDGDCAGRADGRTSCDTTTGICQECVDSGDCAVATKPICDSTAKTCRGCAADAECTASGVCNLHDGATPGNCVAESDVIYIDDGADSGNAACTKTAKCDKISEGVALVAGTKKWILIDAGTYLESIDVAGANTKTVVFKASGVVSVDPALSVAALNVGFNGLVAADVRLEGLRLVNGTGGGTGDGILCGGSGAVVPKIVARGITVDFNTGSGVETSNCDVSLLSSTLSGNLGGAVVATNGSTVTMNRCVVTTSTGGISLASSNFDITNNFIYGNNAGGGNFGGVKIDTLPVLPTKTRFQFNTVADNTGGAGTIPQLRCDTGATELFLDNNVIAGDPLDGKQQFQGGQCKLRYSLVWKTAPADGEVDVATTIRNTDPLFLGSGAKPVPFYHLGTGSPARNAANPILPGDSPTTDFEGEPRTAGGRADMGADEAQ